MRHIPKSICALLAALLLLGACAQPDASSPGKPPDAAYTAAVGTLEAQLAATQRAEDALNRQATQTAAALPSHTPTATATLPGEALPTFAPAAKLSFTVNTNCRSGPSAVYEVIYPFPAGITVEALGRSRDAEWWQVDVPNLPGEKCWVWWGDHVALEGNVFSLPFLSPPPPPTNTPAPTRPPGIRIASIKTRDCGSGLHAVFEIRPIGADVFESARVVIKDLTDGTDVSSESRNRPFYETPHICLEPLSALAAGTTGYVAGSIASATPGNELQATVTLCTQNGLGGSCYSDRILFTSSSK